MMEDERNQEQDGTFLVEEGVPEKASATMEENRLQEENAVSAVPSGAGEFPEQVAAAKEEYWNSVLTGDVMTHSPGGQAEGGSDVSGGNG